MRRQIPVPSILHKFGAAASVVARVVALVVFDMKGKGCSNEL